MADWYFDHLATGTGSGTTPANAWTNIQSAIAANSINNWLQPGDYCWFRRTWVTSYAVLAAGLQFAHNTWDPTSALPYSGMIGWPKSGDPFFDVRPTVAVSAGWDADTNSAFPNVNMATITQSAAVTSELTIGNGIICANFHWLLRGAARAPACASSPYNIKTNWHMNNYMLNANQRHEYESFTLTCSVAAIGVLGGNASDVTVNKATITASSAFGTSLFGVGGTFVYGQLEILSNSVNAMRSQGSIGYATNLVQHVHEVTGIKPALMVASGVATDATSLNCPPLWFDNYFGEGPRTISGLNDADYIAPSSADVYVNGQPAINCIVVSSKAVGDLSTMITKTFGNPRTPSDARAFVNVTSGVPLVVRWPIMMTNSINGHPSFSGQRAQAFLRGPSGNGPGGICYINSYEVSSGFTWSGNSTGAGSFWVARAELVPTQSGSAFVDLILPIARSKAGLLAIGRPEVNSL